VLANIQTFFDNKYFDYSLILRETIHQLEVNENLRSILKYRIKYLTVDEYQDINPIQEKLIRLLFDLGCNLCVVGDDDQTVYQFRGSDVSHILNFEKDYGIRPENRIILDRNFRCTAAVIDVARTIVQSNNGRLPKQMTSASKWKHEDGAVSYRELDTMNDEFEFIAGEIEKLHAAGIRYSDIAILLRKSKVGPELSHILDGNNIPYLVEGVNELFMTQEVQAAKNIINYMTNRISRDELLESWSHIRYPIDSKNLDGAVSRLDSLDLDKPFAYPGFSIQQLFHGFIIDTEIREIEGDSNSEVILYNLGKFSQVIDDFERVNYTSKPRKRLSDFRYFTDRLAGDSYAEGQIENTYIRPDAVNIMTIPRLRGWSLQQHSFLNLTETTSQLVAMGGEQYGQSLKKNASPMQIVMTEQ
jgi:DNA helicase-2/ATP-dependent DNA helicase PcrA